MKLTRIERRIISDLVRSDGELQAYTFYRRYLIPIGALAEAVIGLEKKELVESKDKNVRLTAKAEALAGQGAFAEYSAGDRPWRKCPDDLKQKQLDWREPYVPKRSELAPDLLAFIESKKA